MGFLVICVWFCFLSYVIGVVVGEHRSDRYWREKWWELREEYMSEYPESFEDDPDDDDEEEEDESTRD